MADLSIQQARAILTHTDHPGAYYAADADQFVRLVLFQTAPVDHPRPMCTRYFQVTTEHEAAYRDCEPAQQFTLRAIVQIARAVKATALRYE